jgi:glutamine---fructose-6-phosphate transaminase (isomerizing)
VTTSAMASEIGESADVVAKIVRNRPATRDIAQRIGIGSAPLCVVCGRGSYGHAGVFLRYLSLGLLITGLRKMRVMSLA